MSKPRLYAGVKFTLRKKPSLFALGALLCFGFSYFGFPGFDFRESIKCGGISCFAQTSSTSSNFSQASIEHVKEGELLAKQGDWQQAKAEFLAASKLDTKNITALYDLGIAYAHCGDLKKAVSYEQQVLMLNKNYTAAYIELGWIYAQLGDLDAAANSLSKALQLDPTNKIAHQNLSNVNLLRQKRKVTYPIIRQAFKESPEETATNKATWHCHLGWVLAKSSMWLQSLSHYQKALEFKADLLEAQVGQALALANSGQADKAKTILNQCVSAHPKVALPHIALGIILQDLTYYEAAKRHFAEALHLAPTSLEAKQRMASSLLNTKNWSEAAQTYKEIIADSREPQSQNHLGLGLALLGLHDINGMCLEFKKALSLDPGSASAHAGLSLALHVSGHSTEALAEARKALALDPNLKIAQIALKQATEKKDSPGKM